MQVAPGGSDTVKPLTVAKRVALIAEHIRLYDARILDAGCGGGGYVEYLCAQGARAEGVEFDSDKVEGWEKAHPGDSRVRRGDLVRLNYEDETFDAILCNEVLEHVPDEHGSLSELRRVLKGDGKLFLFTPNRFHPFETHGFISNKTGKGTGALKTFLLPYFPLSLLPSSLEPWARNYWPHELRDLVSKSGFKVLSQSFVWQTLENNSGYQPRGIAAMVPLLRKCFSIAEHVPIVRALGASQLIIAEKASRP
ncbi:class I SAM-dependent methyltransferase [Bradyrhizobium sp. PMVTL-01]|uniref:class I SAM-dependent methyltransferase n=1 Tax=Bradyrhizobium sp. PMVTL-01 TaxID=3434999 RepID=UPI003F71FB93